MRPGRNEYVARVISRDHIAPFSRVELHAPDTLTERDFLGVDPEFGDMPARVGLRSDSERSRWGQATMLASYTRRYHDALADEAEQLLRGSADELLVDEQEVAELLGYGVEAMQ